MLHFLERRQIFEEARGRVTASTEENRSKSVGAHDRTGTEQHDPLDRILELAYVPRPVVCLEHLERGR